MTEKAVIVRAKWDISVVTTRGSRLEKMGTKRAGAEGKCVKLLYKRENDFKPVKEQRRIRCPQPTYASFPP